MKKILTSILAIFSTGCVTTELELVDINLLTNPKVKNHFFLKDMYKDNYFPNFLVDKGKNILLDLCFKIEREKPKDEAGVYRLTHNAIEMFNDLQDEFYENDSEIETAARDAIGTDFRFILSAYSYDVDIEEAMAPREW